MSDLKKYLISSPWTISKIKNFTSFLKSREELQEKKRLKSDLIFIDDLSSYSLKYIVLKDFIKYLNKNANFLVKIVN